MKTADAGRGTQPVSGCLRTFPWGVPLDIKVYPGSGRSRLDGMTGERLRVRVCAGLERHRVNREVLSQLSRALGIPISRMEVVWGGGFRHKSVLLQGLGAVETMSHLSLF